MRSRETLRKGWCPGALMPMETGDGLLVRVRPRAGSFTLDGLKTIAETAAAFGSGEIDLTNRANLQMRGLTPSTWPMALDALDAAGLLDETPSIEAVRNVIVDPLTGLDQGRVDVRPFASALEHRLARNPALHALPGKFGFSISGSMRAIASQTTPDISMAMPAAGQSVITIDGAPELGVHVTSTEAVGAAERLALAFLAIASQQHNVRRMRDAVAVVGSDRIFCLAGLQAETLVGPASGYYQPNRTGLLGAPSQPFAVAIGLPFGRADAPALIDLCDLARRHGCLEVRPSAQRTLVMPVHAAAAAHALLELAETSDLITRDDDPRLMMDVCPGAPSCRNASTSTRSDAQRLIAAFAASTLAMPEVHISGCEKGCARRAAAPLTLVGRNGGYDLVGRGTATGIPELTGLAPHSMAATVVTYVTERAP